MCVHTHVHVHARTHQNTVSVEAYKIANCTYELYLHTYNKVIMLLSFMIVAFYHLWQCALIHTIYSTVGMQ